MASSVLCTVSLCGSSSIGHTESTIMSSISSCSSSSGLKSFNFHHSSRFSQLGLCHFTPWNGLRHMGISISAKPPKDGKRAKCRGKVVYASLFGVGAPEALVIGVVALLVFGPKGLAEVAKNLGKTLRAFQPTIRELQDVSREFKSTLEREIGLDDDPRPTRNTYEPNSTFTTPTSPNSSMEDPQNVPVPDPNGTLSSKAYSSEEYLKITEEQLKASGAVQQDVKSSSPESQDELVNQTPTVQVVESSPPESQSTEGEIEPESQPEAAVQDITTAQSAQKPETEH